MTQPLFVFKNTVPLEEGRELFCEKSSEGVLKPIVEQKSCDEKRTPPSSKNFVFRSHLLFKRRNILQMLFENSNKVRRGSKIYRTAITILQRKTPSVFNRFH